MKRFLSVSSIVLLCILFASSVTLAAERVPLRVARLPLMVQSWQVPDRDTMKDLETKVDRALHVPLNGTLHAVEYLPAAECERALENVMTELRGANRKAKLKDAMKPLAEMLRADLVVCPVLRSYSQYTTLSWSWNHGPILHSTASVELAGYERATDQVFDKKFSKSFTDESSAWGSASALAKDCMDHVIEEAGLRERISKWKHDSLSS